MLIRRRKQNKWSTKFDPFPFIVVRRKGTMTTASRNGKYISHNVSQFKKINSPYSSPQSDNSKDDDDMNILKLFHEMCHLIHTDIPDMTGDQPDGMDRMFMNSESH